MLDLRDAPLVRGEGLAERFELSGTDTTVTQSRGVNLKATPSCLQGRHPPGGRLCRVTQTPSPAAASRRSLHASVGFTVTVTVYDPLAILGVNCFCRLALGSARTDLTIHVSAAPCIPGRRRHSFWCESGGSVVGNRVGLRGHPDGA